MRPLLSISTHDPFCEMLNVAMLWGRSRTCFPVGNADSQLQRHVRQGTPRKELSYPCIEPNYLPITRPRRAFVTLGARKRLCNGEQRRSRPVTNAKDASMRVAAV